MDLIQTISKSSSSAVQNFLKKLLSLQQHNTLLRECCSEFSQLAMTTVMPWSTSNQGTVRLLRLYQTSSTFLRTDTGQMSIRTQIRTKMLGRQLLIQPLFKGLYQLVNFRKSIFLYYISIFLYYISNYLLYIECTYVYVSIFYENCKFIRDMSVFVSIF